MKSRLVLLGVAAVLALALTAPAVGASNIVSSSAASAKTTAEKALAKAKKANQRAKAAQASADAAQASADAAQATADSALATANSKFGSLTYQTEAPRRSDQSDKIEGIANCPGGQARRPAAATCSPAGTTPPTCSINFPYGNERLARRGSGRHRGIDPTGA